MTRRFLQALAVLLVVLGVMLVLGACYQIGAAHAAAVVTTDGAPSPAVTPAPAFTLPWEAWIALGLAAIAGLRSTIHGVRELLGLFKARTATTIDDRAYDALGVAENALTSALGTVRSIAGKAGPTALAVLLLGGGLALQPGCSSWRARTAAGVGAFLDCESAHLDAQLLEDAKAVGKAAVMGAVAGDGSVDKAKLKADVAPLKSDLLRCGVVAAIAALATPAPRQPGAPASAELVVDAVSLRDAFAGVKASWGLAAVKTADGAVQ